MFDRRRFIEPADVSKVALGRLCLPQLRERGKETEAKPALQDY
jgi:hypothetical protein